MIVDHYGIHWAPGKIAYLEQQGSGVDAHSLGVASSFEVRTMRRQPCPHDISLSAQKPPAESWDLFLSMADDPLVRALLPIPKEDEGAYFLEGQYFKLISALLEMSAPTASAAVMPYVTSPEKVYLQLTTSNIMTWAVVGMDSSSNRFVHHLAPVIEHLPGRLLLNGSPDIVVMAPFKRIRTSLDETALNLPWRRIGAEVVRRYMRKEEIFA